MAAPGSLPIPCPNWPLLDPSAQFEPSHVCQPATSTEQSDYNIKEQKNTKYKKI